MKNTCVGVGHGRGRGRGRGCRPPSPSSLHPHPTTQIDVKVETTKLRDGREFQSLTDKSWGKWPDAENLERLLMAKNLSTKMQRIDKPMPKRYVAETRRRSSRLPLQVMVPSTVAVEEKTC